MYILLMEMEVSFLYTVALEKEMSLIIKYIYKSNVLVSPTCFEISPLIVMLVLGSL